MADRLDMNGLWSGWYDYLGLSEAVPFTAWIDDAGGMLAGTILEPNTFVEAGPDDLEALISGQRVATFVTFTKTYREGQGAHGLKIAYEGEADSQFQSVSGEWQIGTDPFNGGRFQLDRSSRGVGEAVLRKVLAGL